MQGGWREPLRPAREWALVLAAFAMPFSIAISQFAFAVALLLRLAEWAGGRAPAKLGRGLTLITLAFVGWALLDIAFSQVPGESLRHAKRFLLLPALWLYAEAGTRAVLRGRLLAALGAGAAGVAAYGIIAYLQGPRGLAGRAQLTQGYMTAGGLMMLAALLLFVFLLLPGGPRRRRWLWPAFALTLVALVFTQTRSAWLGFAAGALLALVLVRPRFAPFFLGLLLTAGFFAPAGFRERLLSSFDPRHTNNVQRVIMWRTGWDLLAEYPLTGVGDLDLQAIYRARHAGESVEVKGHLHSNPVMFAVLWGWPGLVLALGFLGALAVALAKRWWTLARLAERAPPGAAGWTLAALACWLGFMLGGLFEWNFGDAEIALLTWALCGLALAPLPTAGEGEVG
ncbi:O-antigen ligase family protein [bacterium]|nr:O-antigen ligase family protein [bacterium]